MADEEKSEKQKPEKPRKSGGGGGGEINFQKLLIIIGGVIVAQVIVLVVILKMVLPSSTPAEEGTKKDGSGEVKKDGEEEGFEEDQSKLKYTSLKFDYITTKDFQWYILLQLGFKVLPKPVEGEEEEKSEGHGAAPKDAGYQLPPELISVTKSQVIGYFGALSIEEVQAIPRDSMVVIITQKLKPLFKQSNLLLKSISLEQFTPTKVN